MDADYGGNGTVKVFLSRNCTFQVQEFITIHFFWVKKELFKLCEMGWDREWTFGCQILFLFYLRVRMQVL